MRHSKRWFLVAVGLLASVSICASVRAAFPLAASKKLTLGEKQIGGLKPGETVEYYIEAARGNAVDVQVAQIDSDLSCLLESSAGLMLSVDRELAVGSTETVSFVAAEDATYVLKVSSKFKRPESARYSVLLASTTAATPEQQAQFEIEQLITKAGVARKEGQPKAAAGFASDAIGRARQRYGATPEAAGVISRAAMYSYWNGEVKKFTELAEEAWSMFEPAPERGSDKLDALESLAFASRLKGNVERSERLTEELLQLRTAQLGTDHPALASILGELAVAKRAKGDYVMAMSLSRRSLELRERWYGEHHIDLVLSLQNLASISYAMGDPEEAMRYHERSLAIRRLNLPPMHPDIARTLNELGNVRIDLGEFDAAERSLLEAIAIRDKAFGADHPMTVFSRFSLGSMYRQRGELAKAKSIFDEVWRLMPQLESSLPRSQVTYLLQGLGGFYTIVKDFDRAEKALRRAYDERMAINGPESLEVGRSCDDLARLYAKTGKIPDALRYQQRANLIAEKHLESLLKRGSEQEKLNLIEELALGVNQSISLHADISPDDPETARLALETIVNRKGRVLDALLARQARLNARTPEAERTKQKLAELDSLLSREVIRRNAAEKPEIWKSRIEGLVAERRNLFTDLGPVVDPSAGRVKLDDIRAALPPDAALVEFKLYKPFGIDEKFGKEELIAYIIRRDGPIGWVKLGNAQDIESLVDGFRSTIGDPRSDIAPIARILSKRLAEPILEKLGKATRLILSPDGPVNLLPFQAMLDAEGRYLVERYTVSYVTSGRDLIRMREAGPAPSGVTIFADPNFGAATIDRTSRSPLPAYFQPLRATGREAELIREFFPDSSKIVGDMALERTIKTMSRPMILHIATHGFFLPDDPVGVGDAGANGYRFWKPEFQFFRSGLVFAGVNTRPAAGDDGILTALEASNLDLRGTRLVVLSACDTGIGSLRKGEGVFGLRRAFSIAGAEALVMSLWQVSDHSTQELMEGFYKNLRSGLGRADSLRAIQVEMLKKPARKHPYYWASFIHAGAWTPLEPGP